MPPSAGSFSPGRHVYVLYIAIYIDIIAGLFAKITLSYDWGRFPPSDFNGKSIITRKEGR